MTVIKNTLFASVLLLLSTALLADNLWLDVRTPEEYQQGHVQKAKNIPHNKIVDGSVSINAKKDAVIYVYCKSGNRANKAKNALNKQGFTNVKNLGSFEEAQRFLKLNSKQ